ncbi:hypothetical protein TWF106_011165 [Orbilia oligospora]|uniref:Uncharacterized protein n=1 Tax=Orbilia oligospora TaxID=2813651 RepID=A0A6G1MH13_ORBOL|nr:hypothetical protein TWF788_007535 [Orbilia oligospora]KAF3206643.1 hypothetical protein TWF679_008687 [Orbilia oligospora]KAF3226753.1 hypothetical protein TWF106_011165 [Orbilia oligospora]KAF3229473.1 hypothetical protein TWF191_001195 [Orbilia oligospora]KAF3258381.1 hypothetical protein TWF192_000512 [Orbilia oligospora]
MDKLEVPEPTRSINQPSFYQIPLDQHVEVIAIQKPLASTEWIYQMGGCCEDSDKCCIGCCCPCVAYGEVHHKMRNKRVTDYNRCCNGPCWGFCGLMICGAQWIMGMMQRGEARRKYNMKGSGCGDCMRHFFCGCCALIQENREVETRKQLLVPANVLGYQPTVAMSYEQLTNIPGSGHVRV